MKSTDYNYDKKSFLNWFGDYYRDREFKKAFFWFEKAAKQDHPSALYLLGSMYEDGEGVEYNIEKAEPYYRKAAELGDSSAQWIIGGMHQDGEANAEWDYEKAVLWFKKAALNGDDSAAQELGDIYSKGLKKPDWDEYVGKHGIKKNSKEALKWYLLAEKNGSESVFDKLGIAYLTGIGVSKNYKEAAKWFHKGSVRWSNFDSRYNLANLYKDGLGVNRSFYKCYIWAFLAIKSFEASVLNDLPRAMKMKSNYIKTKDYCGKQLTNIELKAGKEIVSGYSDNSRSTSFIIPLKL